MNVPLDWLKEYVLLPDNKSKLSDALTLAGHMLDKTTQVNGQTVFDLELRGNRADCYSILGIAREVSALFNSKLKKPEVIQLKTSERFKDIELKADRRYVRRAGFIEINNVKIIKSPDWLIKRLESYGIESVNNIVDLTNYVMIETGEPMHAFDLDKVGKKLQIRLAKEGEKILTFQGTTLTLTSEDLVWAKEDKILSVAGAIGEKTNSISQFTKNILLEAANYDRANIRRSVHRHNLYTEAGIRHEKELDPNLVEFGISRFLFLLKKYQWGTFKPEFYDFYPKKVQPWNLSFDINRFLLHSGTALKKEIIIDILSKLSFSTVKSSGTELVVKVPTSRTDVTLEEDLFEEVLRIHGYDKIPVKTLSLEIPKNITPDFIKQEQILRHSAASVGMNETISLSFVSKKYSDLNKFPEDIGHKLAKLVNPPSPDTQDLRQSLIPNLVANCQKIINERGEIAQFFEIGKTYTYFKGNYSESRKIGFAYWSRKDDGYSVFKGFIEAFFDKSGLPKPDYKSEIKMIPLTNSYDLFMGKELIGFGGKYGDIYLIELDLDSMLGKFKKYEINLWPKYPPQIEDLTFTIPDKTNIGNVLNTIKSTSPTLREVQLKDVYENSFTFKVVYQSNSKTLTNSEIKKIRLQIIDNLKKSYGATVK